MQTFLPYRNFKRSARVLDNKRLGKQRVECYQILLALLEGGGLHRGWSKHPAARMWKGHEGCLYQYTVEICQEWARRGFLNTKMDNNLMYLLEYHGATLEATREPPVWLGRARFHKSHRSNLMRKSPLYHNLGWQEPHNLEYWWPVPKESPLPSQTNPSRRIR